ncbi:MAG: HTH-like domain-containing protein [Clostridium chrysemydis]|uniref:HTH-like domain-containing protein n=1 Tax=Clostridium chrysemydis TaxID=2665504 RepID=UPI003F40C09C
MNASKLGIILKKMYESGEDTGEQVAMIHLFAIRYADIIQNNNISKADILRQAKMKRSYSTEISKGIKLSKYVKER